MTMFSTARKTAIATVAALAVITAGAAVAPTQAHAGGNLAGVLIGGAIIGTAIVGGLIDNAYDDDIADAILLDAVYDDYDDFGDWD